MAPEQLEGLEADARTDIFAFGALLYEMATGQRAFRGETKTSLIASIVSQHPEPISQVAPMSPPALDHVVRRCLEKAPDDRWQSAHDIASELQWISEAGSQVGVGKAVIASRRSRRRVLTTMGVLGWIVAIVLAAVLISRSTTEQTRRPVHAEIVLSAGTAQNGVVSGAMAVSPDGSRIVFSATSDDGALLTVRDLRTGRTTRLAGTENAIFPFWSPDSQWIGFFADGRLKKISASGGAVQSLADAPQGRGGTWGTNDTIIYAPDILGPLLAISESGGTAERITGTSSDAITHRNPHLLPGDETVLFIDRDSLADRFGSIAAIAVDGNSEARTLVEQASNPQFANGYLFWVREGNLLAQRLDPESLELSGSPRAIAEDVEYYNPRDVGNFSVSAAGVLAWRKQNRTPVQLTWIEWSGREIEELEDPGFYSIVDFTHDGQRVLLTREDEARRTLDLWVMDLERKQMTRSTFTSTAGLVTGAFSPDGDQIAVSIYGGGGGGWTGSRVLIQSASGSGEERELLDSVSFLVDEWSGDGKYLVGDVQENTTAHDIGYFAIDDPGQLFKFADSPYEEAALAMSSDGEWIVYSSNESGIFEIYLSDFPEGTRKWQISKGDCLVSGFRASAEWSLDGDAIYYRTQSGFMRVPLTRRGDRLEPGVPRPVELEGTGNFGPFVPRQEMFLTIAPAGDQAPEPIRMIQNWEVLLEGAD